jgi:hypothetical protein
LALWLWEIGNNTAIQLELLAQYFPVAMRTTTATTFFLAAIAALGRAEEVKTSEVPGACERMCAVVSLASSCDANTSVNVRRFAALCAACMSQNGKRTDGKGSIKQEITRCS